MQSIQAVTRLLRRIAIVAAVIAVSPCRAVDAGAAEQLIKDNKCVKCHVVDRKKDGPAYRDVAAKFRGEPDAEAKVIHHITSGEMVKFADGHEEHHKKIKVVDQEELKNLARGILSLEGGTKY